MFNHVTVIRIYGYLFSNSELRIEFFQLLPQLGNRVVTFFNVEGGELIQLQIEGPVYHAKLYNTLVMMSIPTYHSNPTSSLAESVGVVALVPGSSAL